VLHMLCCARWCRPTDSLAPRRRCQRIVHQDVKIDNIFVVGVDAATGEPDVVLADLGSCSTESKFYVSYTRPYITPEMAVLCTRLETDAFDPALAQPFLSEKVGPMRAMAALVVHWHRLSW
jgi:serine/threonine protein kinase